MSRRPRQKTSALTAAVTIPAAILVGSALIGAGLYFGLRARPPVSPASATARSAPPTPTLWATPEKVPVTLRPGDLDKRVLAALEVHRAALVTRCWEPAAAEQPELAVARFTFNYTFAADGTQRGRGVEVDRTTSPELTACVLRELPALKIAPIGRPMTAKVVFQLP